ncbi:MAG: hypothetical protein H0V89_12095 [Deltaproteobacteria bacterium]|nr:hypothetical protein [Deltaproteobacteria bacterium]
MAKTLTFLQLAEEFGGTRFGPFDRAEVRLGSDPSRSDITLPESLGVLPEHLRLLKQGDDSFILAPVERTAAVYHWKASGGKPRHVTAPMAIPKGDGFSLVTPEGPRFYIQSEVEAKAKDLARDSQGPPLFVRRVTGTAILREIRRRGFASFATTRIGNWIQWAKRFVSTGQMFSPYYIVLGMVFFGGWFFAGGMSCTALKFNSDRGGLQKNLSTCRDQLGVSDEESGGDPTVGDLVSKILGDREWKSTLSADKELYDAFGKELRAAFDAAEKYRWVYKDKASQFTRFKKGLEGRGMPPSLVRVLSYAAAQPLSGSERDWNKLVDSEEQEMCGRGPVGLTFRQGWKLGFYSVQPDALVDRQIAESSDTAKQVEAIQKTLTSASSELSTEGMTIHYSAVVQGQLECIYAVGDDNRLDVAEVTKKLDEVIGTSAKSVPREQEPFWIAARLVRLYTYDFTAGHDDIVFDSKNAPSTVLGFAKMPSRRTKYAIQAAAEIMARAVVIPCIARLDREATKAEDILGELPQLGSCGIVRLYVEYDQL